MKDGRIAITGPAADVLSAKAVSTIMVDLQGKTLLPGWNDAHIHLWKAGKLRTSFLDVRTIRSPEELNEELRLLSSQKKAGEWIVARGYNEQRKAGKWHPTRIDLDEVSSTIPYW